MRFRRSHPAVRGFAVLTSAVFLSSVLHLSLFAATALADAREELTKAEDYFLVADFATALTKVEALLDAGDLQGGTLRDAWVLKARCEVGLAHKSSAVEAFCEALRVEPGWRPDPDLYTKDELEVFEQAKASCTGAPAESKPPGTPTTPPPPSPMPAPMSTGAADAGESKPFYKKPIFMVIGGALLVGGAVALAGGGGDDDDGGTPLPDFPPPPTN